MKTKKFKIKEHTARSQPLSRFCTTNKLKLIKMSTSNKSPSLNNLMLSSHNAPMPTTIVEVSCLSQDKNTKVGTSHTLNKINIDKLINH